MPVAHHKPQYRYRLWLIPSGRGTLRFWATTRLVTTPLRWFILISFISLDLTWIVLPYNSSPFVSTTFSTYALKAKHLVVVWQVSLFSPCREDILPSFHYLETAWDLWYCQLISIPMTTSKWKSLIFVTTLSTYSMNESLNCTLGRHSGHTTTHNKMHNQWRGSV